MILRLRVVLVTAGLMAMPLAVPITGALAQQNSNSPGMTGSKATSTYNGSTTDSTTPGATGHTIVPGSTSSEASTYSATKEQKTSTSDTAGKK